MTIPIEEQIAALQFTIADIMAGPDISIGFVADRVSRLRAALATLEALRWRPIARWRHKKRGSEYNVLTSVAEAQCALGPINEGDHVTVYQGDDRNWWVRKTAEFQDGRFERIDIPPPSDAASAGGEG